jgi:hypothetical protein
MKETNLFARLRPHLAAWGEYDRVENTVGSGMADIYYNIGGHTGWIETKVAKGDLIMFEKFQLNWIRKHHRQGARLFVMVLDKQGAIHLYPAGVILNAQVFSKEKWVCIDQRTLPRVFSMLPPYKSWKSIRDILVE